MARRERNVAISHALTSLAKSARTLGTPRRHAGMGKKNPTGDPVGFLIWCWGLLNDGLKPAWMLGFNF